MANRFEVQVVALDRFTKTFRNLNNQASKAARPLVNVQRQVGALAREMHLDKAAKGLGKVSDAAVTVTRTLGLSLGPLEALLGAGGIVGGLVAATGAALALGVNVARTGFQVDRAAQAMGVSTKVLQQYRGAMELMGIDASVADQTLGALGRTLQDARFGRDQPALQLLRQLGIGIPLKNGAVDQVAALDGISRALSQIADPQVRAKVADVLHIPQEALPALMQGAEAMQRLRDKAHELGVDLDENGIKKANELTTSINLLKVALEGAGNTMGTKLLPPMASAVDYLTKLIDRSGKAWQSGSFSDNASNASRGMWDMVTSGPRFLRWLGSTALHGNVPTTESERRVTGTITGPEWGAGPATSRSASDRAMAAQMQFTPEELARQQANEDSAENRRQLVAELARTRDPGNRAILQGELNKLDARLHVDVTLRGAPAGTSATARVASADVPGATARVQFAMPTGDMP